MNTNLAYLTCLQFSQLFKQNVQERIVLLIFLIFQEMLLISFFSFSEIPWQRIKAITAHV